MLICFLFRKAISRQDQPIAATEALNVKKASIGNTAWQKLMKDANTLVPDNTKVVHAKVTVKPIGFQR